MAMSDEKRLGKKAMGSPSVNSDNPDSGVPTGLLLIAAWRGEAKALVVRIRALPRACRNAMFLDVSVAWIQTD
jgi:hypothetical protein